MKNLSFWLPACMALAWALAAGPAGLAQPRPAVDVAGRQYSAAAALQNRQQYDLAAGAWADFVKRYPRDPRAIRARHYLGVCLLKGKQYARAADVFAELVATAARLPAESFRVELDDGTQTDLLEPTYLYLAVARYRQSDDPQTPAADRQRLLGEALAALDRLGEKFPKGKYLAQAEFYRGEIAYAQGDKPRAVDAYRRFLKDHPHDALASDALYGLGVAEEETSQAVAAEATYRRFLQGYPQHALAGEVGMRIAEMALAQHKFAEAERGFAAAAGLSGFALADYALMRQAASLQEDKQYVRAAEVYASLPKRFPQSKYLPAAQLAAGKCLYMAGKWADARQTLEQVIVAGGPSAIEATHWLAASELKQKRPAEAQQMLDQALAKLGDGPQTVQLQLDRADALFDQPNKKREALAAYAAIATRYPQHELAPQAEYLAALAALEAGDYPQASTRADEFLKRHGSHARAAAAQYVAAESRLLAGQPAGAARRYAELLSRYPDRDEAPTWRLRQALALLLEHRADAALEAIKPVIKSEGGGDHELLAEAYFLRGSAYQELKQYDRAAESLEKSLKTAPRWRQADETLLALAAAQQQLGRTSDARKQLERLLAEFPDSRFRDRAQLRLAELAAAAGDDRAAVAEYRRLLAADAAGKTAPQAWFSLAWSELRLGAHQPAIEAVDTLLKKFPQDELAPAAHYVRGLAREALHQYAPAAEDLEAFLRTAKDSPDRSSARYMLGVCQAAMSKPGEAVATLEALLRDDPKCAVADKALNELAWALRAAGKPAEAAKRFEQLARDYPASSLAAEGWFQLGEQRYQDKQYDKAAQAYYMAMEKAGKTELGESAAHKLGFAYYHLNKFADARQTFSYQAVTFPSGPLAVDAAFMEAECLFKEHKYADALAAYDKLPPPKRSETGVLAGLHAGQSLAQLGQWDRSLKRLEQAAKIDPASPYLPEILYEEGWAQQNLSKPDEALKLYEQVTTQTEGEAAARARFMIGEIQFEKKNHQEALKNFFEVAYGYAFPQWQAAAQYEAGRCFEVLGKKDQARQSYQEVVDKHPGSPQAALARQRLTALGG
ncbi:MAG TPA: tetratricopeptide repeat protein [Pirellulales bacterium]|jgi:TolA-binding protein|nr:tetratricopeptide repeat protein [Pirellulales bacterium]